MKPHRFGLAAALVLCVASAFPEARAEDAQRVTREDYARAESMLPDRARALVLNERVMPRWLGSRDEFWYRRETSAGHEFVNLRRLPAIGVRRMGFRTIPVQRRRSTAIQRRQPIRAAAGMMEP